MPFLHTTRVFLSISVRFSEMLKGDDPVFARRSFIYIFQLISCSVQHLFHRKTKLAQTVARCHR